MVPRRLVTHLWVIAFLTLSLSIVVTAQAGGSIGSPVEGTRSIPGNISAHPAATLAEANRVPDRPSLIAPPGGALNVTTDPMLRVRVTDPDRDRLHVTFFAREARPEPPKDFTIIALPDTQRYSDARPDLFAVQTRWIVDNRDALNIVYVAHEGDLVQDARDERQWQNADAALSLLEDPITTWRRDGIPYSVVPGNHDEPGPFYNRYFGPSRFQGRGYYGGNYPVGSNTSNYTLFSSGGMDFIAIGLDYEGVEPGTLDWADGLLKDHGERRAIVVSHHILEEDGSFGPWGQLVYDTLKDNPNLFLMLAGHRHAEARRTEVYGGHVVHALLANYQHYPNGGNGFLRLLEFSPEKNQIRVSTYSPSLNQYETDSSSQFVLDYDMTGGNLYQVVGTVHGVASGSEVFLPWPRRSTGTRYEWYVEVSDGTSTTTGPVWEFTTEGPGMYRLTTEAGGGGSVTRDPDHWAYRQGDVVQLTAHPADGYLFWFWSRDLSGTANPSTIVMDSAKSVLASFRRDGPLYGAFLPLVSGDRP